MLLKYKGNTALPSLKGLKTYFNRLGLVPGVKLTKVMRLTAFLLTFFCMTASARTDAQISLSFKNEPLKKVITTLTQKAGLVFFMDNEAILEGYNISAEIRNATVNDCMALILKNLPLEFSVSNKTVFIRRKETAAKNFTDSTTDPLKSITGKVLDAKGEPVPGATVAAKKSGKTTFTDEKGNFSIDVSARNELLTVTGINIETYQMRVNNEAALVINVRPKVNSEDEVVVTVNTGYEKILKDKTTGSIAHVNNDLFNRRVSNNVLDRLEGVTSGLLVDGKVDNPLGISIRGRSTLYADSKPLIVIDNFPYTGDLSAINPNDVESVTVLKDAAAAAIWGAYSGNGVIVITTKKGKYDQPVAVELNANYTVGNKPDLFYSRSYLGSKDFIALESLLFSKGFYNDQLNNTVDHPAVSSVVEILDQLEKGLIDQATATAQLTKLETIDARQQLTDNLYRRSGNQQYAINIRGGSAKSSYYLSTGYTKNLADVRRNGFDQISLLASLNFKPVKNLEVGGDIAYIKTNTDLNGSGTVFSGMPGSAMRPYLQLKDEQGNPLNVIRDYRSSFVDDPGVSGLLDWHYNPLQELGLNDYTIKGTDVRLTGNMRYTILKGLVAEIRYQYQNGLAQQRRFVDAQAYEARNLVNQFATIVDNEAVAYPVPSGGILSLSNSTNTAKSGRALFTYSTAVGAHAISALAGMDVREVRTESNTSGFYGYDNNTGTFATVSYNVNYPTFPSGQLTTIPTLNTVYPYTLDRFRSYFVNASYIYDNRYQFSTSVRLDQSNIFGVKTNQKGIPLWSVGGKWNISNEKFFTLASVSLLTLRVSYGFNGNFDKTTTSYTTFRYEGTNSNNSPIAGILSVGNPQLRWEKIGITNIGLDFALVKDVISGSVDYYRKQGKDLIGRSALASSTGFTFTKGNYSEMKGHGLDLVLNAKLISKAVEWDIVVLASLAKDKVTKNIGDYQKMEGKPINGLFSYKWGGLNEKGDPQGFLGDTLSTDYSTIINRYSAKPELFEFNGSSTPQWFGSIRSSISWKGFSVSTSFIYKASYVFRRQSVQYNALINQGAGHVDYLSRWQKAGDEKVTNIPALVYIDYPQFGQRDNFYTGSSILAERGDHIRWQDANVSYTLSEGLSKRLLVKGGQIYFYANNLGVVWRSNKLGIDPNFVTGVPTPKSYAIGIRTNF